MPKHKVPNVLIVENQSGNVYIVENKEEISEVTKILKKSAKRGNNAIQKTTPQSDDMIIEEYLDEELLQQLEVDELNIKDDPDKASVKFAELTFIDTNESKDDVKIKRNDTILKDHPYTIAEHETLDQSMDNYALLNEDVIEENFVIEEVFESIDNEQTISKKQQHKTHQLTGKAACKYCETVFRTKELRNAHKCVYLQCNPKNFICRICNKELSKKTFSNHLHETLDCQYCSKSFVNPRNLKTHILKLHTNEGYVAPKYPKVKPQEPNLVLDDDAECLKLDEETGLVVSTSKDKKPRKKYPRKTGRFECDLCGRILRTSASLNQHFMLHSKIYRYVCETCGEKFTTKTGIQKHACLNRRRKRPEKDFRTEDVRHCKYCDVWFSSLEENKMHDCAYQSSDDPKVFRCRFCNLQMSKNSFNKHMNRHLDQNEYFCDICGKQLANETSLRIHLTVHTGDKNYKCDKCEKSFINKNLLIRHSRFHGNEIPVYTCDICNREVASKFHLKIHYSTVHGDMYACKICKKSCESKDDLKQHYKANHKPYTCDICNRSFILERYLKMHLKIHNDPITLYYLCPYCNRKFSKRAIANHVFKFHREHFEAWRDENTDLI